MSKILTVILGAGASFDVIPPDQRATVVRMGREYLQPPLTNSLFNLDQRLEYIAAYYPKAHAAIGSIRYKLKPKVNLEALLSELKNSTEPNKNQQFRQIPLYLQHIFGAMCDETEGYCHNPMNYSILANETLSQKVAYITLNYDTLFDTALCNESDHKFTKIDDYIPEDKKWTYIKLHGSINWGRQIRQTAIVNPSPSLGALLENISKLNPEEDLEQLEIDESYKGRPTSAKPYYPALSVPIDGKYEINCPNTHITKLVNHLKNCFTYLIIGTSGRDKDLLDLLLENCPQAKSITLVGGKDAESVKKNFQEHVHQFRLAGWNNYDNGFSHFMASNGIENVLSQLV